MSETSPCPVTFGERIAGPMALGMTRPVLGALRARREGPLLKADLLLHVDDVDAFVAAPEHVARVTGTVTFADLADGAPVREGSARIFVPDAETGMKRTQYALVFDGAQGQRYRLEATRFIRPGRAGVREQRTLYARLARADAAPEVTVAAGVLRGRWRDLPGWRWLMARPPRGEAAAQERLRAFARRELATPLTALAT